MSGQRINAARAAVEQTDAAVDALFQEPKDFLHFPWEGVDELCGGIGPGNVWFVGGFSGNGKTTFKLKKGATTINQDSFTPSSSLFSVIQRFRRVFEIFRASSTESMQ